MRNLLFNTIIWISGSCRWQRMVLSVLFVLTFTDSVNSQSFLETDSLSVQKDFTERKVKIFIVEGTKTHNLNSSEKVLAEIVYVSSKRENINLAGREKPALKKQTSAKQVITEKITKPENVEKPNQSVFCFSNSNSENKSFNSLIARLSVAPTVVNQHFTVIIEDDKEYRSLFIYAQTAHFNYKSVYTELFYLSINSVRPPPMI